MKIYIASVYLSNSGDTLAYFGSKRAANKHVADSKKKYAEPEENTGNTFDFASVTMKEFTPTKKGILDFLNNETPSTDNG